MKKQLLTRGKYALVDDEDFEWISKYKWQVSPKNNDFYAIRTSRENGKKTTVRMAREIMNANKNDQVDHVNGNKLDNRKENLRLCNALENGANRKIGKNNTSGYKGVGLDKKIVGKKKYRARIRVKNKLISLKYYVTAEEAAHAYNQAALKYFGEFARLN